MTPVITELLNSCFVETKSTRQIQTLEWPSDVNSIMFRHKDSIVTQEDCSFQIERTDKYPDTDNIVNAIKVRKLNISWLFRDGKNFTDLVNIIN